jgi:hypothetical protein
MPLIAVSIVLCALGPLQPDPAYSRRQANQSAPQNPIQ